MAVSALDPLHRGASGPSLHPGKERGQCLTTLLSDCCLSNGCAGKPKSKQALLGKSHNSTQDEINWDITRKKA